MKPCGSQGELSPGPPLFLRAAPDLKLLGYGFLGEHVYDLGHHLRLRQHLEGIGRPFDLDACEPYIALHGLEILPPTDLLDLDGGYPIPDELRRKARSQRVELYRRKANAEAELP